MDNYHLNKNALLDKNGFTLLEIMATVSLFVVVILLTGSMYVLAQQSYTRGMNHNELVQNERVCLDRLSRELRQANELITDLAAPTSTILFQDGHNLDDITYIRYYLNGNEFKRSHIYYYFDSDPSTYVYYNSVDVFGDPPNSGIFEDRVVGEYFDSLTFSLVDGLIDINMELSKSNVDHDINTKIYIRDW